MIDEDAGGRAHLVVALLSSAGAIVTLAALASSGDWASPLPALAIVLALNALVRFRLWRG